MSYRWKGRVYWEHTDAGGVVYHARYISLLERARSDWLRELGFAQSEVRDRYQRFFAISRVEIDFRFPARLDDELEITVELQALGPASLNVTQNVFRGDGLLLASARVRIAALDVASFRPARMPDVIIDKLKREQQ